MRVGRRELHDHVAQDGVRNAEDALEFRERPLARGELHNIVEAVGAVVDLVGQLAPTPIVRVADLATGTLDHGPKTPDGVLDLLLVELGYDYEHDFVSIYLARLLRSNRLPEGKELRPGSRGFVCIVNIPTAPICYKLNFFSARQMLGVVRRAYHHSIATERSWLRSRVSQRSRPLPVRP